MFVVIERVVELGLARGDTRVVKAGDVVMQRGTMHRWKNLSRTEGARVMVVVLGAEGGGGGEYGVWGIGGLSGGADV